MNLVRRIKARWRNRKVNILKVKGTCDICGHYGTCGFFEEGLVCALCIKGIIGKHPDEPWKEL